MTTYKINCSICKKKVELPHSHAGEVKEPVETVEIDAFMQKLYNANGQMTRLVEEFIEEYKEEPIVVLEAYEKGLTQGIENMKENYLARFSNAEARIMTAYADAADLIGGDTKGLQQGGKMIDATLDEVYKDLFDSERE